MSDLAREEDKLTLRDAQKQFTREKLMKAAREIFHETGYTKATVEDIVEKAGASRGTFYLYFHSKDEILGELFVSEHVEAVLELLEHFPDEPNVNSLREWISEFFTLYAHQRLTIRAWIQAGSREAELRASSLVQLDRVLEGMSARVGIIRARNNLITTESDARLRSLLMFIQMQEFAYYRYIREYEVDQERGLDLLAEAWVTAIFGRASPH